jgi:hypothetical protein
MSTSPIHLEVQTYAGSDVADASNHMQILANMLGINVTADLNGVRMCASPGGTGSELATQYFRAINQQPPAHYKHAGSLRR